MRPFVSRKHTREEAYKVPSGYISNGNAARLCGYTLGGIAIKLHRHGCPCIRVPRTSIKGKNLGSHGILCWRKDVAMDIIFTERNKRA